MNWRESVGLASALVAIVAGGIAIYDYFSQEDDIAAATPSPAPPNDTKIVVLARTTFNDSGQTYVLDYDGNLLKLNSSITVVG